MKEDFHYVAFCHRTQTAIEGTTTEGMASLAKSATMSVRWKRDGNQGSWGHGRELEVKNC